jgi:hypothetical protein
MTGSEYRNTHPEHQPEATGALSDVPPEAAAANAMERPSIQRPTAVPHEFEGALHFRTTAPESIELPPGFIAAEAFVDAFRPEGPDVELTKGERMGATTALHRIAHHVDKTYIKPAHDAGKYDEAVVPPEEKIIQYVTDPATGRQHKVVSVDNLRKLVDSGEYQKVLGKGGRLGLEQVLRTYPAPEATPEPEVDVDAVAEAAEAPADTTAAEYVGPTAVQQTVESLPPSGHPEEQE